MDQPKLITTPFAQDAPSSAVDEIPETLAPSDPIQNASWTQGFPSVTMVPLAAGGIPPRGQSMNGVLKAISEHSAYVGGGGQYKWDQDWVDAKGGYAKGAVLQSDDGLASYVSAVDNNTNNFNTNPSSIGTSWLPYSGAVKIDSAGTGLIQDGTALRVKFGTTAGTVMQGNDSRVDGALQKSQNLSDLDDASTARDNLGLGTAATRDVVSSDTDTSGGNKLVTQGWMGLGVVTGDNRLAPESQITGNSFWGTGESDQTHPGAQSNWSNVIALKFTNSPSDFTSIQQEITNGSLRLGGVWEGSVIPTRTVIDTSNILKTTGNNNDFPMSQKAVTDALNNITTLGVGQTWLDVTGSRATDVTYTNTTGRPIYVMIQINDWGTGGALVVNGISANRHDESRAGDTVSMVIPNGATYHISGATISKWLELR